MAKLDDAEIEAHKKIMRAVQHVDTVAARRLQEFRSSCIRKTGRNTTWQEDLAWAESDPDWQVAFMVVRLRYNP